LDKEAQPGPDVVTYASYSGGGGRRLVSSRLAQAKLVTSYLKNRIQTRDGVVAPVTVEPCLTGRGPGFNPQN
jgi:hypothetical protein